MHKWQVSEGHCRVVQTFAAVLDVMGLVLEVETLSCTCAGE